LIGHEPRVANIVGRYIRAGERAASENYAACPITVEGDAWLLEDVRALPRLVAAGRAVTVALVGLGALVAASVQATTGLGFALVLTPVMFALLSPVGAIVTVTALGLELNLLVLVGERRRPRVAWRELGPILAAAVPGTVCGVLLLRALPKPVLQVSVGVAVIAAAVLSVRLGRASAGSGSTPGRLAVGFTTGALTTSTGISGPPLALWLSRRGLAPGEIRDSLSAMFLAIGVVAFLTLVPLLRRAHLDPALLAIGLSCVLAGHALGSRAFARLQTARFEPLLFVVIVCAGVASIVAGAGSL
jgi:uncharacterized protein